MTSSNEFRARRPQAHEALLQEMVSEDVGFPYMRDVLLFAAAVGLKHGRSANFSSSAGEAIRYDVLTGPAFADALVSMIAASEVDDPEILDDSRLDERVRIFERYVCGGLEYIQELMNVRSQPVDLVVGDLVTDALSENSGAAPASIDDLLAGL